MIEELENNGFYKFESKIEKSWISKINNALPEIFKEHELLRRKNGNPITSEGLAMNALVGNPLFFDFLQHLIDIDLISSIEESYFKTSCILNSLTALSNIPGEEGVFHKKIHRDIRGYSGEAPILLNMLVMLDDFTVENGATLLYPRTHLEESKPSLDELENNCVSAVGKAGDIIIWNSNLFHASGVNKTDDVRRAIPLTFSVPYYKQLLDYPRAIGYEKYDTFNPEMKKLLGYDSRVPESISEWYSPLSKLLYKN
jgi:ectoine hydroxylase-related dioxygenase (phytanoyl-CoA dioxygenase family)